MTRRAPSISCIVVVVRLQHDSAIQPRLPTVLYLGYRIGSPLSEAKPGSATNAAELWLLAIKLIHADFVPRATLSFGGFIQISLHSGVERTGLRRTQKKPPRP